MIVNCVLLVFAKIKQQTKNSFQKRKLSNYLCLLMLCYVLCFDCLADVWLNTIWSWPSWTLSVRNATGQSLTVCLRLFCQEIKLKILNSYSFFTSLLMLVFDIWWLVMSNVIIFILMNENLCSMFFASIYFSYFILWAGWMWNCSFYDCGECESFCVCILHQIILESPNKSIKSHHINYPLTSVDSLST